MKLRNILLPIGTIFKKLMNILPAVVLRVEQAAKDGKISMDERKDIAWSIVDNIATEWGIELNWLARWVIGLAINRLAKALPPRDKDMDIEKYLIKFGLKW